MPRTATGAHVLTPAERQAHQRAKRKAREAQLLRALHEVMASEDIAEARDIAERALLGDRLIEED